MAGKERNKSIGLYNNAVKVIRTKRKRKGGKSKGFNSQWVVYCTACGTLIADKWDTDFYNCPCPECGNKGKAPSLTKEKLLNKIGKYMDKMYNPYKSEKNNLINRDENAILSSFRETRFKSELENLVLNFWFKPKKYNVRKELEHCIDNRGRYLSNHEDFMYLLKLCYDLAYGRYID